MPVCQPLCCFALTTVQSPSHADTRNKARRALWLVDEGEDFEVTQRNNLRAKIEMLRGRWNKSTDDLRSELDDDGESEGEVEFLD